jgi:hypothetical protein
MRLQTGLRRNEKERDKKVLRKIDGMYKSEMCGIRIESDIRCRW